MQLIGVGHHSILFKIILFVTFLFIITFLITSTDVVWGLPRPLFILWTELNYSFSFYIKKPPLSRTNPVHLLFIARLIPLHQTMAPKYYPISYVNSALAMVRFHTVIKWLHEPHASNHKETQPIHPTLMLIFKIEPTTTSIPFGWWEIAGK